MKTLRAAPWRSAASGAVAGAAIAALVFAPAQWLQAPLHDATGGHLRLVESRGFWWRGQAQLALSAGAGSRESSLMPGTLRWRATPGLRGNEPGVRLTLTQSCCMLRPMALWLGWRDGGLNLRIEPGGEAALAVWPAAWLAALGTPWNTLTLGGRLSLQAQDFGWHAARGGPARVDGQLQLQIVGAASRLSPLPVLGNYQLSIRGGASGSAPVAQVQLQTLEGPLQLRGEGRMGPRGLQFNGEARAEPGHEAALDNLLNLIGRREGARSILSVGRP